MPEAYIVRNGLIRCELLPDFVVCEFKVWLAESGSFTAPTNQIHFVTLYPKC